MCQERVMQACQQSASYHTVQIGKAVGVICL